MANQESAYKNAYQEGDPQKEQQAYDAYRESMERSGQKPKTKEELRR